MAAADTFTDTAKVMAKGQITIPKDVREALGVSAGSRVNVIVEGDSVRMFNSAVFAMRALQQDMAGEAERAGLDSEEAVSGLVKSVRDQS
ncbi:MAG: AbrB/MazE/SpoVT family DNA-binding domain-containing protein [Aeromonadales bacterium]|nr:AbrB/MazE/SpoVT family DNA-binding domain-containing protein [Aeromonadales bacterium]MDY2891787.1 AbrB/MazE/SpoVT family DNA-binding domain-containing protein [Succinivibrio sp.]